MWTGFLLNHFLNLTTHLQWVYSGWTQVSEGGCLVVGVIQVTQTPSLPSSRVTPFPCHQQCSQNQQRQARVWLVHPTAPALHLESFVSVVSVLKIKIKRTWNKRISINHNVALLISMTLCSRVERECVITGGSWRTDCTWWWLMLGDSLAHGAPNLRHKNNYFGQAFEWL